MERQTKKLQHHKEPHCSGNVKAKHMNQIIKAVSSSEFHTELIGKSNPDRNLEAMFIGPRAENIDILLDMVTNALRSHQLARLEFLNGDPIHVTGRMKVSDSFLDSIDDMKAKFASLLINLKKFSTPFYSPRYEGHMLWETTIPSMAGLIAAMLYNQNNVTFEVSPLTTILEFKASEDLTKMFGYPKFEELIDPPNFTDINVQRSWGHLTSCGSIANTEAFWSARNVKFFALSFMISENHEIISVRDKITVVTANGTTRKFSDLNAWELLNIPTDEALKIPIQVANYLNQENPHAGVTMKDVYNLIEDSTIQKLGICEIYNKLSKLPGGDKIKSPVYFSPGSSHYSIRRAISLLGLGENALILLSVDEDTRLLKSELDKHLEECLKSTRPVITVVAVLGSTEESSVDPLEEIIFELREKYRKQGLDFNVHADCAYGGYFMSTIVEPEVESYKPKKRMADIKQIQAKQIADMNSYTRKQFQNLKYADSITVDPHKAGYIPYACGALVYRNSLLRIQLNYAGAYISPDMGPNIGIFGAEGSKSGAQAAAVYLSHQCIPLNTTAHGALLRLTLFNTKVYYCHLLGFQYRKKPEETESWKQWLPDGSVPFRVTPLPRLPSERHKKTDQEIEKERNEILKLMESCRKVGKGKSQFDAQLLADKIANETFTFDFNELGPDQNIVSYALNFYDFTTKQWNTSLQAMNDFNTRISQKTRPHVTADNMPLPLSDIKLFLSQTSISQKEYGEKFINSFIDRTKTPNDIPPSQQPWVTVLRTVLMGPWSTDTITGSFLDVVLDELENVAFEVMKEWKWETKDVIYDEDKHGVYRESNVRFEVQIEESFNKIKL